MNRQAFEFVIIGGGVIGMSLAYELSKQNDSVIVLERDRVGRQASWAGAGILPLHVMESAVHPMDQLAARSFELHSIWADELLAETKIDTGYRQCGALVIARTAGELASLKGQVSEWTETGVAIERISNEQIPDLVPGWTADLRSVLMSVVVPGEVQIRNPHHLAALTTACRNRGVQVLENTGEVCVARNGHRVSSVTCGELKIRGGNFCFATGAWSGQLLESLNISISILPVRGQMVLYKLPSRLFSRIVYEGMKYIVPRDDGHVLVGSTIEEAGFDVSTTSEAIDSLRKFASGVICDLNESRFVDCWAGLRPASFDGFPYLGPVPGLDNAWAACGHFRSGLLLSTATAEAITALMLGRRPMFDLAPFRLDRG